MEMLVAAVPSFSHLRVAIVHYWFVGRAGGERVVESIAELFPQADLFSLVAEPGTLSPELKSRKLQTSFLQDIPGSVRFHRHFFLLQPFALEQFDLSEYDIVISSESGPAKGIITSSNTCHICYCHSPMRYIWEMYPQYKRTMNPVVRVLFSLTAHYMRLWDYASAARVDYFIANSNFIASRIWKQYGRESEVIYPPVETSAGGINADIGDYYLIVGRLVDYKRCDLAVGACTKLGRPLRVIGDGPELKRLRQMAGPTVQFLGKLNDFDLREQMAHCRALLFPGIEDFGIVPVEAQSFGRPVIAYSGGGALETIRAAAPGEPLPPKATGVFFENQTVAGLVQGIFNFEANENSFDPAIIRQHSLQFDQSIFKSNIAQFIQHSMDDFSARRASPPKKATTVHHSPSTTRP